MQEAPTHEGELDVTETIHHVRAVGSVVEKMNAQGSRNCRPDRGFFIVGRDLFHKGGYSVLVVVVLRVVVIATGGG